MKGNCCATSGSAGCLEGFALGSPLGILKAEYKRKWADWGTHPILVLAIVPAAIPAVAKKHEVDRGMYESH
jgi:hypothetical protein